MTERKNIEIDYCPKCRGVWLDRGELDKLLETSAVAAPTPSSPPPYTTSPQRPRDDYYDRDDDKRYDKRSYKKKSILSELFDF